jgi:DNA invertase Pin-like site-specific DNA recombinase
VAEPIHAGYVRVSTRHQRDESDSPANQRQILEASGCTRIYEDLAVSGFKPGHRRRARDFARLMADIEAGQVQTLTAVRFNRLIRRDALLIELAETCQRRGVTFRTVQGGVVDVSTAAGWLNVKIHGVFDEHYSRALSDSIRGGLAALHARGIPARTARALPFHLEREPGTRHGVRPSRHWPHARHAVEQFIAGEWSTCQAAAHLFQTCQWRSTSSEFVKWIQRPAIAGHMAHGASKDHAIIIRDCWPALLSADEWARAKARIAANKGRRPIRPGRARLLSGVCACALCGGKMAYVSASNGDRRWWYVRCRRQGCVTSTVSAPPIWEALLDQLDQRTGELVRHRAADAGVRREPPEVATWRLELQAREALPVEMRQQSDNRRILELRELIAQAAQYPGVVEDWWPDGMAVGSLQFWAGREESDINADLRRIIRAAVVDPKSKALVRVEWAGG